MRAELNAVEAGFTKLPGLTGNQDRAVFINASGTAQTAVTAEAARALLGLGSAGSPAFTKLVLSGGVASIPTAGTGEVGGGATSGLELSGHGSTRDVSIYNSGGQAVIGIPTGTLNVAIPPLGRFFWDGATGAGDTYTHEAAPNTLNTVVGDATTLSLTANSVAAQGALSATGTISLTSGQKVYLDGVLANGNTYIIESSADTLDLVAGDGTALRCTANHASATGKLSSTGPIALVSGQRLYFDGIPATGDTYDTESSADTKDSVVGGATTLRLTANAAAVLGTLSATGTVTFSAATSLILGTTHKWHAFNDGTNAYFTNAAAGAGNGIYSAAASAGFLIAGVPIAVASGSFFSITGLQISVSATPASAGAAGQAGQVHWDENFFYICIATNTWQRVAHATW